MKRYTRWILAALGLYVLATVCYIVKSEAGIKLTHQPHHGWLFPLADKTFKKFPLPGSG